MQAASNFLSNLVCNHGRNTNSATTRAILCNPAHFGTNGAQFQKGYNFGLASHCIDGQTRTFLWIASKFSQRAEIRQMCTFPIARDVFPLYIWLLIKIPLSRNGHSSRIKILLSRNFRELHVYLSRGPCWPTTPLMKIRSPPAKLRQRITDHFLVAF